MYNTIRELAKSWKYQTIYNSMNKNFSFLLNKVEYNQYQIYFLYWSSIYSSLYEDLATNEKFLNEKILEDTIRTDAYLYYKRWKREDENRTNNFKETISNKTNKSLDMSNAFEFDFKKPNKKRMR